MFKLLVGGAVAYAATLAGDYVLIVFCSFIGALLAIYHFFYMFNLVDNFFDTIEKLENGAEVVC